MYRSKRGTASIGIIIFSVGVLILIVAYGFLRYGKSQSIGGQTDEHGCLVGAGYSWCEAKNKCLRPFEEYCTNTAAKVAVFNCSEGKSVQAVFYPGDDKFVDLTLYDGGKISVPRAISASGARYANADESFVFWNKGDTAFITENGTTTYDGCVTNAQ